MDEYVAWLNPKGVREHALKNALAKWWPHIAPGIRRRTAVSLLCGVSCVCDVSADCRHIHRTSRLGRSHRKRVEVLAQSTRARTSSVSRTCSGPIARPLTPPNHDVDTTDPRLDITLIPFSPSITVLDYTLRCRIAVLLVLLLIYLGTIERTDLGLAIDLQIGLLHSDAHDFIYDCSRRLMLEKRMSCRGEMGFTVESPPGALAGIGGSCTKVSACGQISISSSQALTSLI